MCTKKQAESRQSSPGSRTKQGAARIVLRITCMPVEWCTQNERLTQGECKSSKSSKPHKEHPAKRRHWSLEHHPPISWQLGRDRLRDSDKSISNVREALSKFRDLRQHISDTFSKHQSHFGKPLAKLVHQHWHDSEQVA